MPLGVELRATVLSKRGADATVRLAWAHNLAWAPTGGGAGGGELRLGAVLESLGRVPLPPYMKREADENDLASYQARPQRPASCELRASSVRDAAQAAGGAARRAALFGPRLGRRLSPRPTAGTHGAPPTARPAQTAHSAARGSVAAPTAGLHFSEQLMGRLKVPPPPPDGRSVFVRSAHGARAARRRLRRAWRWRS